MIVQIYCSCSLVFINGSQGTLNETQLLYPMNRPVKHCDDEDVVECLPFRVYGDLSRLPGERANHVFSNSKKRCDSASEAGVVVGTIGIGSLDSLWRRWELSACKP